MHLSSTLAVLTACWQALSRINTTPCALFGDNRAKPCVSTVRGAITLLEIIDRLRNAVPSASATIGLQCAAVYGLWIFEGLRLWIDPASRWEIFESDFIGKIVKSVKGRKSQVTQCALHPIQMLDKYGFQGQH